ncbi:hypothetical protein KIKIMORA_00570 [Brevundimonas phage vB_BpoS-Kikimora]|uniref:Uncharacterized protein n=1 Tax=Brevundimonas phage vB_BpoS-Kikimora TaxID=2948601 RepID=A0A9E7SL53_9CAUD|nr:hypothetical protein KIKIMORA_00570 [Brevundimonas phage vB_BpoS-Kikimora]
MSRVTLQKELVAVLKTHVKADATGLSPAVSGLYLVGFEEAAEAIIDHLLKVVDPTAKPHVEALDRKARASFETNRSFGRRGVQWALEQEPEWRAARVIERLAAKIAAGDTDIHLPMRRDVLKILEPFVKVMELYSPQEDDDYQVVLDSSVKALREALPLLAFRQAAALSQALEGDCIGINYGLLRGCVQDIIMTEIIKAGHVDAETITFNYGHFWDATYAAAGELMDGACPQVSEADQPIRSILSSALARKVARYEDALKRIAEASPRNANANTASDMSTHTGAIAASALADA